MIEETTIERNAIFRVGKVISVDGRRVRVEVDKLKNSSHLLYRGQLIKNIAVSGYVKIKKGFIDLIAKVEGEFVKKENSNNSSYRRDVDYLSRHLDLSLIGYLEADKFVPGIREMPLIDNECFILTEDEFRMIHTFSSTDDNTLDIGTLAMEPSHRIAIDVNQIFASHIGIFGNTGSGKSYTLTKIYHELFSRYQDNISFLNSSKFVLIDFNGEYVDQPINISDHSTGIITDRNIKSVYRLSTQDDLGDKLPLPDSAINDPILWTVLLDATEKTQAPFISKVLRSSYWNNLLLNPKELLNAIGNIVANATKSNDLTIDRQLSYNFLLDIIDCLGFHATDDFLSTVHQFRDCLQFHSGNRDYKWVENATVVMWSTDVKWYSFIVKKFSNLEQSFSKINNIDLIRFKLIFAYYQDVISGYANREHIGPLIKRLSQRLPSIKRLIEVDSKNFSISTLTIISFRNVNLDMRKVIPLIICKYLYSNKKHTDPHSNKYLNIIIDEAHNILSAQSARETEAWRDYRLETFEEIIKEGRKFGVFLTLASQRPQDISETIISQIHNFFLHRLVNERDIKSVEKAVTYLDKVSFESLPILPTGTCVMAGIATHVPILIQIGELPLFARPNSQTMEVASHWK